VSANGKTIGAASNGRIMMTRPSHLLAAVIACAASAVAIEGASGQEWQPSRPVTLVVPFPAGGGNDALARLVAERMSKTLGQQVVVENRGGAGGTVAARAIAKSPPDGHTILLSYTGTFAINPTLYPNAGYDPRKDFVAIGSIGTLTSVLVSHPSLPVKSTGDLIEYAKKNPGKINYGFVPGTVGHISTEMFARSASIKLTNIPYKGNGNAIADLMGGHVSMMFISILPVIGQIHAGTLNALAVASPARSSLIPNVPTIAESGVPGFSAIITYGLAAPAGTPRPVVARLNKELQVALNDATLRKRLDAEGGAVLTGTQENYAKTIDDEEKKWGPLVKSLNLKVE
jgi:tripartite-type tricarboxylate transporter receptor subunit TctC